MQTAFRAALWRKSVYPLVGASQTLLCQAPFHPYSPSTRRTTHRRYTIETATVIAEVSSELRQGPIRAYDDQVREGLIREDPYQRGVVQMLQELYDDLEALDLTERDAPKPGLFTRLFGGPAPKPFGDSPKGLYLYGDVGCGKSYLMDLFYDNLPAKYLDKRKRIHFHAFMYGVHKRGHEIKQKMGFEADWVVHVGRELAAETKVLCFDEFQVTDIADAMILRRLIETMLRNGVISVMTSNRAPDELYHNGIQRDQFIPCIELIKERFKVKCLDSGTDYRKLPRPVSRVYYHPVNEETTREFEAAFAQLTGEETPKAKTLNVWGRDFTVPKTVGRTAMISFKDLCGKAMSAADYLEITNEFDIIFISNVPQMTLIEKDNVRRLILFIDSAYEARTRVFIQSEKEIKTIFTSDNQEDEVTFAWDRTVSRLTEMENVMYNQH